MSYERRVMSSETTFKVVLMMDNTHIRQRDSGYSVVSSKLCASRHRTGELHPSLGTRILVNCMILGVCELALKLWIIWKGLYLENDLRSRDQNRIREIRPSGIAGRLAET
jgi:hypothetical protein